jgi:hypothetical protein
MNGTLVLAGTAIAVGLGVLIPWLRRSRSTAILDARESLDDEAFYGRYYAESKLPKPLVSELRQEVAETLKVPAAKLRPEDRFGKQIGTYWITSDDLDVLAAKGRNRAKALGLTVDLQKLSTVDDYIRCFTQSSAVAGVGR